MSRQLRRGEEGSEYANAIVFVNPNDKDWTEHRYVLWFGAYGWTRLCVWANSLEDGLDEAVDWIEENAPGLLCDDAVNEAYNDALAQGKSVEEAAEIAEVDTTCAGNHCVHLNSSEWGILAEDPSRDDLLALLGRTERKPS